jgi:hypothetical protein
VRRFESCRGHHTNSPIHPAFSFWAGSSSTAISAPGTHWVHNSGAGGVHRVGDLVEVVVKEVAVPVEGHRRRGLTEHVLDDLDVGAGR